MAQTVVTQTSFGDFSHPESLKEPAAVEHDGILWSVKLQNTFLINSGRTVLAVWEIAHPLCPRPTAS